MEIVVRNGKYFTIGDNGAEFFKYQKGDIIFNARQTQELLSRGKISSGNTRGRALASGTAFDNGSYSSRRTTTYKSYSASYDSSSSKSSKSSSSDDSAEEFKETLDWIEVAIDRIERAISRLDLKASSVFKSWSSRNENLTKEISKVAEEIDIQSKGYERYMQQANSVGLSEDWAYKVRNGLIDISDITDEDLNEKISEYKEWYINMPLHLVTGGGFLFKCWKKGYIRSHPKAN